MNLYVIGGAILAVVVLLVGLFWAGVRTGTLSQGQRTWQDYGNFYIVAIGLALVVIGFLIVLQIYQPTDGAEALGFLTAFFGAIVGLVGTFFGVKASADARAGAETLTTSAGGVGTTTPTITIDPPTATTGVSQPHDVTATVTSVDGSPAANVEVTFTVTDGPDLNTTSTATTDAFGRASFTLTNNGTAGTDTIEAAALRGTGTAKVEFT
jgi:Bacterial Ig-like domain (group 1)